MEKLFNSGIIEIDLHLFDDVFNKSTSDGLAAEQPDRFWKNRIIHLAEAKLVYNQFADKYDIPAGNGKTVEMRIFTPYPIAAKLAEGTPPDAQAINVASLTATIEQYGAYTKLSDIAEWTSKDNLRDADAKELAIQAAKTIETITREEVVGGSNVVYAPSVSGGTVTPVDKRSDITTTCKLDMKTIIKAVSKLKAADAEPFEGGFGAVIHPIVAGDLQQQDGFVDRVKYGAAERLFAGEIGKMAGARFTETSLGKIFVPCDIMTGIKRLTVHTALAQAGTEIVVNEAISKAEAATLPEGGVDVYIGGKANKITAITYGAAGQAKVTVSSTTAAKDDLICGQGAGKDGSAVFATMIFGRHAYGTTKLENGGLEFITKSANVAGGPLNQYSTAGFKLTWVAKRIQEANMIRVESSTDDASSFEAN